MCERIYTRIGCIVVANFSESVTALPMICAGPDSSAQRERELLPRPPDPIKRALIIQPSSETNSWLASWSFHTIFDQTSAFGYENQIERKREGDLFVWNHFIGEGETVIQASFQSNDSGSSSLMKL